MTWPTVPVSTTNLDADPDSPLSARPDLLDLTQKFNQLAAHVSVFMRTVLDDIDAAAARATLGAAGTGVANTYTANQVIAKSTPGFSLNDTSGVNFSSLDYIDNGVLIWRAGMRGDLSNEYIIFDEAAGVVRLNIVPGGAATYTGAFDVVGALTDDGVPVVTTTGAQTLTNKTLTAPAISQIVFPATQVPSADANTLDDYEEGTWILAVGGTATYTVQNAAYTKIGRIIHISGWVTINLIGTGSLTTLSGLPFTANSSRTQPISGSALSNIATAIVEFVPRVLFGTTTVVLYSRTVPSVTQGLNNIFGNGASVEINGVYDV